MVRKRENCEFTNFIGVLKKNNWMSAGEIFAWF